MVEPIEEARAPLRKLPSILFPAARRPSILMNSVYFLRQCQWKTRWNNNRPPRSRILILLSNHQLHEDEPEENSPIPQVALTVPTTDDPSLPVVTFRMWVLGTVSFVLLSFLNQFFWYRTEPLTITAISAQMAVVPLGRLMAARTTDRVFLKGPRWEFTLNPGPFNVKEHVLITIFANSGAGTVYAMLLVTVVKVFYNQQITFCVAHRSHHYTDKSQTLPIASSC